MKQVKELQKAPAKLIINMDETPLYFNMPASRTFHEKGERKVRVKSTGTEKTF